MNVIPVPVIVCHSVVTSTDISPSVIVVACGCIIEIVCALVDLISSVHVIFVSSGIEDDKKIAGPVMPYSSVARLLSVISVTSSLPS